MNFWHEVAKITELPAEALSGYRYTVAGGTAVYIEGHRGVKGFAEDCACFRMGKDLLNIMGSGLTVRHLSVNDAVVVGSITSTEIIKG